MFFFYPHSTTLESSGILPLITDDSALVIATQTLIGHNDEVWVIKWNNDGTALASGGKDGTAIIWRKEESENKKRSYVWSPQLILGDHRYAVVRLAWSSDDSRIFTASENIIRVWDAMTGRCIRTLHEHQEAITAIEYLPSNKGMVSASMDGRIIIWDSHYEIQTAWDPLDVHIMDLAVVPDTFAIVTLALQPQPSLTEQTKGGHSVMKFDLETKQTLLSLEMEDELTNVQISKDSRYALINQSKNPIKLLDLLTGRVMREYQGLAQSRHVIRSCFGGADDSLVISGGEDGKICIWDTATAELLHVVLGHGPGTVNTVTWNPGSEQMFASSSDDRSIKIWEIIKEPSNDGGDR